MKKNNLNRNIRTIIKWVLTVLITFVLIVAIVVGVVYKKRKTIPEETLPVSDSTIESVEKEENPVISDKAETHPPIDITPITPEIETPEVETPDIDVGEMERNPEPEVIGGGIEYETKE